MNLSVCLLGFCFLFCFGIYILFLGFYFILFDLIYFIEFDLFMLNSSMVVMTLLFDWMSLIFISFVMIISSVVSLYSSGYMHGDLNILRFMLILYFFVFSMILLIVSPNLISLLLGWDGLGLVSYCLVIYYQNIKSYNAGLLTIMINRLGDVSILLAISWMLNYGSWNYIYYMNWYSFSYEFRLILFLLVMAVMTKSAQVPFSSWLPAAMAAPTPVSALVHSSTLVTAGVYLMIRFNYVLLSSGFSNFLLLLGMLTMLMSGIAANLEYDLSKIIALSTLSQLGFMVSTLSMGLYIISFFHLLTHALFKSLLFLCAGSYIHNLFNIQDIRYMGSMFNYMPVSSVCLNVSSLCLCGIPFMSGFYSKDLILDLLNMSLMNCLIYFIYFFSTGLTLMYSLRLFYYSMISVSNCFPLFNSDDDMLNINISMVLLLIMSVFGGSFLMWLIFPFPFLVILPIYLKLMTIFVILIGLYFGFFLFSFLMLNLSFVFYSYKFFFGLMMFMPYISTGFVSFLPLYKGFMLSKVMDQGWYESIGGQGLYNLFIFISLYIYSIFDYKYKIYLLSFIFWIFLLFVFIFF
uniref:NADH dehydrogenase subunit 5 n=1 Tax=Erianthus versicolor TaxID=470935 RepID=UPI0024110C7E|nr:NADH dehydrogenase subunit 5 [Erianthus versicolor]WEL32778.1 NADH dehydrogenase subunit 5 [Erianthus versicolor]